MLRQIVYDRRLEETLQPDIDKRIDQSWHTLRALLVDRQ
jgi:hypothetical protein